MPWTKLDDGFHEHYKTIAMSDKAFRLFTCSLTYSSRHKLRGRLSPAHLSVLFRLTRATKKHVDELIVLRSFDLDGEDILIHDFEHFNPTNEELARKRAEAGKKGAESRWHSGENEREPIANATSLPSAPFMANDSNGTTRAGYPDPVPDPVPLPDQTQKSTTKKSPASDASRGTRLADPFELPDEWSDFAKRERPQFDPRIEAIKFANYWHAIPGAKGLKLSWKATWENYVLSDFYGKGQHSNKPGGRTIRDMSDENRAALIEQGVF